MEIYREFFLKLYTRWKAGIRGECPVKRLD